MAINTVAAIGGITAIFAATIAIVVTDIKRVVAYSTISQLGYMIFALGVGGYVAAIFHLFNHAFFKALLFLGSGSVNHATGTFDMRRMGGLARYMPVTFTTFVIASLSLGGIFPLSGFWSKDEIILDAWNEKRILAYVGLVAAFMTSLYIGRVVFMTFTGEYKGGEPSSHATEEAASHGGHSRQPHESPVAMLLPMVILAGASIFTGFANISDGVTHFLNNSLPAELAEEAHHFDFNLGIAVVSTGLGVSGFVVAWAIYGARLLSADRLRQAFGPVHTLVENKYYMDHLYEDLILRRLILGNVARGLAFFDRYVVDGAVNGLAMATRAGSSGMRYVQSGQVQLYGAAIFVGVIFIALGIMLVNPP